MKKVDKNSLHIPYILTRLLLVGLIIYFLIQAFSSYAQWYCAGVSVAEKGVSEFDVWFCKTMGFYDPNRQNVDFTGYLIIATGLYLLLLVPCITVLQFLTKKFFKNH